MLTLIDLDIEALGYTNFISAWLYQGQNQTFLVDPGPAATVDHLIGEIESRGIDKIDWVLLTHIHLDHAGGTGHLIEHFPGARVVCHEKAARHLADPAQLMAGSRKVLKTVADAYGDMRPVPPGSITTGSFIDVEEGITVIPTPGHAAHHQCFVFRDILFCGELCGIFQKLENRFYLRPATPPRFVLEDFLDSMHRVRPYGDRMFCFGHYGSASNGAEILETARRQLLLWVDVIRSHLAAPDMDRIINDLMENDPVFSRIRFLSELPYQREMYYIRNSITGILGYLEQA